MDEIRRRAQRARHAKQRLDCPCGRAMWGNGWKSHARRCPVWLETHGWPFTDAEEATLRAKLRDTLPRDARAAAYRQACIEEAQRRGLLDASGKATIQTGTPPIPGPADPQP